MNDTPSGTMGWEERFAHLNESGIQHSDGRPMNALADWQVAMVMRFCRSELSRREKELNERWEAREKRLREAMTKAACADDKPVGECGILHAFDQAAALKD